MNGTLQIFYFLCQTKDSDLMDCFFCQILHHKQVLSRLCNKSFDNRIVYIKIYVLIESKSYLFCSVFYSPFFCVILKSGSDHRSTPSLLVSQGIITRPRSILFRPENISLIIFSFILIKKWAFPLSHRRPLPRIL